MRSLSLSNDRLEPSNKSENKHSQIGDVVKLHRLAALQNGSSCFNSSQFVKHHGDINASLAASRPHAHDSGPV